MKGVLLLCLLLTTALLLLAACGASRAAKATNVAPPASIQVDVVTTAAPGRTGQAIELKVGEKEVPTPASAVEGHLVLVFERSGGLTGIRETYEIYSDGRIAVNQKDQLTELQVAAGQVETLLSHLEELGFADAATSRPSGPSSLGADRIASTLTLIGDGKPITATMVDGTSDLPAGLVEAFSAVGDLIASASQ